MKIKEIYIDTKKLFKETGTSIFELIEFLGGPTSTTYYSSWTKSSELTYELADVNTGMTY